MPLGEIAADALLALALLDVGRRGPDRFWAVIGGIVPMSVLFAIWRNGIHLDLITGPSSGGATLAALLSSVFLLSPRLPLPRSLATWLGLDLRNPAVGFAALLPIFSALQPQPRGRGAPETFGLLSSVAHGLSPSRKRRLPPVGRARRLVMTRRLPTRGFGRRHRGPWRGQIAGEMEAAATAPTHAYST